MKALASLSLSMYQFWIYSCSLKSWARYHIPTPSGFITNSWSESLPFRTVCLSDYQLSPVSLLISTQAYAAISAPPTCNAISGTPFLQLPYPVRWCVLLRDYFLRKSILLLWETKNPHRCDLYGFNKTGFILLNQTRLHSRIIQSD